MCLLHHNNPFGTECRSLCPELNCRSIIERECPDILYVPDVPVLLGHVYFVYTKQNLQLFPHKPAEPEYVCYNETLCDGFLTAETLPLLDNVTCHRYSREFFLDSISRLALW